jgi:hypothetical protein
MAEEMCVAGLPFVVVDPVGCWFGLRSGADGSRDGGLPVPIFGGKHGDMPLERGAGELLADLVVEKRLSCVLDLSRFDSEGDKKAFLLAFGRRLYLKNEDPLHLFLEEADDYIPQRPMRDEAQLLRAWENIVRRGRSRGLGITLITQRSASVNKMVLTQVETLFAMRTTGPQDIAAIEAWVKYHQVNDEVVSSLATLKDGEAWVWSPSFLGLVERHQIRRRRTFDSAATPKNFRGDANKKPATLADVDLSALREQMTATIEKAKAEDPRELRKQVADLKKQLALKVSTPPEKVSASVREKPILTDADRALLEKAFDRLGKIAALLDRARAGAIAEIKECLKDVGADLFEDEQTGRDEFVKLLEAKGFQKILGKLGGVIERGPEQQRGDPAAGRTGTSAGRVVPRSRPPLDDAIRPAAEGSVLGKGERKVLIAVAQYPDGVMREQLTVLTGYRRSTRDAYLQRLSAGGFVEITNGGAIRASGVGVEALGDFEPLPTGDELRAYWLERLPEGERRILAALVKHHPRYVEREVLEEETGYKRSTRDAYLQRLGARRLIEVERGRVRASQELWS